MVIGGLFPALGTLNSFRHGDLIEGQAHWIRGFGNPNELAYILVMLVPLAAVLATGARLSVRLMLWAAIGLYVSAIYLTFSRGSLMGLAGVMVLLALRQRGLLVKAGMAILLIGGLVFVSTSLDRSDGLSNINQDYTFNQRIATVKAGLAMFAAHPIVGVGINCAVVAFPLYAPADFKAKGALVIHNTIVQALSKTGVLGFIPFILLIICALSRQKSFPGRHASTGGTAHGCWAGSLVVGRDDLRPLRRIPAELVSISCDRPRLFDPSNCRNDVQ